MLHRKTFDRVNSRNNMFLSLVEVSIPSVIVQIILGLIPFLNAIFMSRFFPSDTPGSNVISVATPSVWLLNAFCYFPILGTSVSYAMLMGKKKFKEANDYANSGFFIGLITSVLFTIIGWFALKPFIWVTSHHNAIIYHYSVQYIHGMIIGYPFWVTAFYMSFMIRNYGWIWKSMFNFVILIILVSLFDFLFLQFIYLPNPKNLDLGFMLVGLGNAVGYFCIWIIAFLYLHLKKGFHFRIIPNKKTFFSKNIFTIIKMGSSSFILNLGATLISFITNIAFAWIVIPDVASRIGSVNGSDIYQFSNSNYWQFIFGLVLPVWIICLNPTYGINAASRLLLAYNYAKKDENRVKQIIKYSLLLNLIYLVGVELIIIVFGKYILELFNAYNGIQKEYNGQYYIFYNANSDAHLILGIIGLFYFAYSIPAANLGMSQILHKPLLANFSAIQRPVLIEVIVVIIATGISYACKNPWIFWWSFPIMDIISLILGIFVFRYLYKKMILTDENVIENIYKKTYA